MQNQNQNSHYDTAVRIVTALHNAGHDSAAELFRKTAEQGHALSQKKLSEMCEKSDWHWFWL